MASVVPEFAWSARRKFWIRSHEVQLNPTASNSRTATLPVPGPAGHVTGPPGLPPQAPRANAICERIIGTLRRELFDRLLTVNEHHLRRVLTEYLRHYNTARPHRALGQLAPAQACTPPPQINLAEHRIRRKQVLSGLIHEYQAAA